ncbi:MAG: Bax inhibitor-1 family protein [Rhodothermales bacterium]
MQDYAYSRSTPVAQVGVDERADFIMRTYVHLFAAMLGFALIEVALFKTGLAATIATAMLSVNWLLVLGGFMIVGWFASRTAMQAQSTASQYGALAAFVAAEAVLFVPMLYIADLTAPGVINSAAIVTLLGFAGLTAVAITTRKDFSFLGGILRWGFIVALVLIVAGVLFGFELGTFFSVGMVALAGGAVLYDTSNVLHHYPQDRHVAAALSLFASVALMFWYILRLFMSRR